MRLFKSSIATLAGLIFMVSPILQIQTASASIPMASTTACGTSACCCCSVVSPGVDGQSADNECQCSISDSQEPFDVDASANEIRVGRDILVGYELSPLVLQLVSPRPGTVWSTAVTYDTGKSPPVYLLACSFLI